MLLSAQGQPFTQAVAQELTSLAQAMATLDSKDQETLFKAGEVIRRLVEK